MRRTQLANFFSYATTLPKDGELARNWLTGGLPLAETAHFRDIYAFQRQNDGLPLSRDQTVEPS